MDVAACVLADIGPDLVPPRSVRETGEQPWRRRVAPEALAAEVVALVRAHLAEEDGGNLA
jgi:hypothetical protein